MIEYVFICRHFSHMNKSRIFKNLNLRRKAERNFRGNFLENCFRHLKLYSNPPSWFARSRFHMGIFWITKGWSSHFWEGQPFSFCYVGVHHQRRLKSTKTGIMGWEKVYIRKLCSVKVKGFWFKNYYLLSSICCSYSCHRSCCV